MRGYGVAEILIGLEFRVVLPPRFRRVGVRFAIGNDEAIAGDVFCAGDDFHFAKLLRCVTEKRLVGMGADRLGETEIFRMA